MFYVKFADKGGNLVGNSNIYNVEGDKNLSLGRQPLTIGRKCVENLLFSTVL